MAEQQTNSRPQQNMRGVMGLRRGGPPGSRPVEKAKDFKGSLKRLLKYLGVHKLSIFIVFVMAILSSLFGVLTPKVLSRAMNILYDGFSEIIAGKAPVIDFDTILKILILLGILYFLNAGFNYLQGYIMAGVSQKIIYRMRREVDEKLTKLPISYFDKNARGDILSRITNDIDNIGTTLQQSAVQVITSIVTITGVLVMMLYISPLLALVVLMSIPLTMIVTMGIAKRSQKYFTKQWSNLGDLNGHIEEMFTGASIVKAYGYEEKAIERFCEQNEALYENSRKAQFISGVIMPLTGTINNIAYVAICIVGGLGVINGTITFGDVTAFIQYQKQFSQPITQMANLMNVLQSAIASSERVFELLDEQEEEQSEELLPKPEHVRGEVDFEHVSFGYTEDKKLIRDMNIHVEPGQLVAIVGPTGAGKTTLVNLLMRFYEIGSGSIKVDGIDIRKLDRNDLRDIFGMVLQDTWLFSGTIADNIAYGSPVKDQAKVREAAQSAHIHRFIKTLSDGYGTILNEEGTNVSQGQKQLLTIARAMISRPDILILDEATSSVDTRTELQIQQAMEKLLKGHTSFVIAHRLSTIRNADLILVMKDGDIIEQGTHESLMAGPTFYAELYNSQFAH
ncbi:MAG: ABC transporter ATP-binding protein/permease [Lachnospiraceae bacterium]|nr:ABC transporter ATP-binding protein/permease [Lachnospiraceae bacterium]